VLVRALGEQAQIRAVASEAPVPLSQARHVSPTLEDAYLHLLGGYAPPKAITCGTSVSSPSSNSRAPLVLPEPTLDIRQSILPPVKTCMTTTHPLDDSESGSPVLNSALSA
jgi:hypothetical protein